MLQYQPVKNGRALSWGYSLLPPQCTGNQRDIRAVAAHCRPTMTMIEIWPVLRCAAATSTTSCSNSCSSSCSSSSCSSSSMNTCSSSGSLTAAHRSGTLVSYARFCFENIYQLPQCLSDHHDHSEVECYTRYDRTGREASHVDTAERTCLCICAVRARARGTSKTNTLDA